MTRREFRILCKDVKTIAMHVVCFFRGHNLTTDHPGRGFASLDGAYTKAVCTRCDHQVKGQY